jgi:hypothetical protein
MGLTTSVRVAIVEPSGELADQRRRKNRLHDLSINYRHLRSRVHGEPMTTGNRIAPTEYSRRQFLGLGAAVAGGTLLAACGRGSGGSGGPLKFWDQIWGAATYTEEAKRLTEAYVPAAGRRGVTYQSIP